MTEPARSVGTGCSVQHPLIIGCKRASARMDNVTGVVREILQHLARTTAMCRTLPPERIRDDVAVVARDVVEHLSRRMDGEHCEPGFDRLQGVSARWARDGVPIDSIQHAMYQAAALLLERLTAGATGADTDAAAEIAHRLIPMLTHMSEAVLSAYLRELAAVETEQHSATRTLAAALLGGKCDAALVRECGIDVADEYTVLAVGFPTRFHPAPSPGRARIEVEFGHRGIGVLSLLEDDGGTVLVPPPLDPNRVTSLVDQVGAATGAAILAVAVDTTTGDLAAAAEHAHDLLDLVERSPRRPGVYRSTDLAVEYQLTRPGVGRDLLRSLLAPLEPYPVLLETLDAYLSQNLNRKRVSRMLHVHPNTLYYRLKRVLELTGYDPCNSTGAYRLHAALMIRHAEQPRKRRQPP